MKFCTKCGAKLGESGNVCPNCGYDSVSHEYVKTEETPDNLDKDEDMDRTSTIDSHEIHDVMGNSKKRKVLVGSAVAVVFIVVFIFIGKFIGSPERAVAVFQNAAGKNDTEALSKVLYTYDGRLKITPEGVKPLLKTFKTVPSEFTDVVNNLNSQVSNLKNGGVENKASNLYVTKAGRTLLFFPKYKIAVNPVFLTVTSNIKGADIMLDGRKIANTDSESFSKQFGPYIPGIYSIQGKADGAFGEMNSNVKVDFIKDKKQRETVNALKGLYLRVNSNYTNNQVYIDGKDTGKFVNPGDKIGPIAAGSNIYSVINYNGQKIKSAAGDLSDNDFTIYFDYSSSNGEDPEQQKNAVDDMITGYSSALANALTYGEAGELVNYMYPGSKLYSQQMKNINSYYKGNNNFYEKYDSAVVNSYKMDPDGKSGTVNATEVYDINEHYGESDSQDNTRTFQNVYKFKYNDTSKSYQLTERTSAAEK